MLPLQSIEETLKTMRTHQATAKRLLEALNAEIVSISADTTRNQDYKDKKIVEARSKATPAIYETLGLINKEHKKLVKASIFWKDKQFVLSQKPLTEAKGAWSGAEAKDAGVEATSRLAKMMELSKMENAHLQLAADDAKQWKRYGELYLILLENSSRDVSAPSWKHIDLGDVVLEDQTAVLDLIREAGAMQYSISFQLKEAQGINLSAVDRLAAARMTAAVQPLNG